MKAGLSGSFCLIVYFLVCSSEAQKNIRPEQIPAEVGKTITLPCKVPNNYKIENIAVEWSRPDQDPEYVLYYRDGYFIPHNQHPSYQNRVDLQDKDMKDGDASLILRNVMMEDNGRYECLVFEEGKNELISNIILVVHLSAQTNIKHENIPAELGQDVILPCKVPNNNININITAVEWIRPDLDPEYVLFYRDGHLHPDSQHPSYQNRVDLNEENMKDGDFSLILKNVMMDDRGRYECWFFEEGKIDPISIIKLEVYLPGEKFEGHQDGIIRDGGNKTGIIVGPVVGVILLLAVVSVGFLIYRRHRRQNPNLQVPPDDPAAKLML